MILDAIRSRLGSVPEELLGFYNRNVLICDSDCRVNLLSFDDASAYTERMQGIPLVNRLGLWVLSDACDSNPYCFISNGPCKGGVIRFSHDPEPAICFASINAFIQAVSALITTGGDIDDLQKEHGLLFPTGDEITALCREDSDDAVSLICLYLPVTGVLSSWAKKLLTDHIDFYVREAFAVWLEQMGQPDDLIFARTLAEDLHSQVAVPGGKALAAISSRV